jgi:hypothetical protein
MRKIKVPVRCLKCGHIDINAPTHTGTASTMCCPDCNQGKVNKYGAKLAQYCRNCCPTGHGTR